MNLLVPIVMIVASNVLYNLFTKTMPAGAHPFAALVITYLTAGAVSFGMLLVTAQGDSAAAFRSINWTSAALGASIVGLELGYIYAYRAGWNISVCSLVANIALAVILLFVGLLFFSEKLSHNQLIGIVLCVAGLFFLNRR